MTYWKYKNDNSSLEHHFLAKKIIDQILTFFSQKKKTFSDRVTLKYCDQYHTIMKYIILT